MRRTSRAQWSSRRRRSRPANRRSRCHPASSRTFASSSSSSSSGGSKPFRLDPQRVVFEADQEIGRRLHEWSRATDEHRRRLGLRPCDLFHHRGVDPPGVAAPSGRLLARQRVRDEQPVARGHQAIDLFAIDDVGQRARGIEKTRGCLVRRRRAVAEHRHQRDHPGSSGHEQQWTIVARSPYEMSADWAAELNLVPHLQLAHEIRRHLAIVEALDRQSNPAGFWWRGDRVAAFGLVAVLGGQPNIDVLTGEMSGPHRDVEVEARDARRLMDELDELSELPRYEGPPQTHGAASEFAGILIAPVALLAPRVSIKVVAVGLPESRLLLLLELDPAHPLRALPEIEVRDEQSRRTAVLRVQRLAVE